MPSSPPTSDVLTPVHKARPAFSFVNVFLMKKTLTFSGPADTLNPPKKKTHMPSTLVQHTYQQLQHILRQHWEAGQKLCETENWYCNKFDISRHTLRKAFDLLGEEGIVSTQSRSKIILKKPKNIATKNIITPISKQEEFERFFFNRISTNSLKSGDTFSELELSTLSACTIGTVREVLQKISSLHLISKQSRKQWKMVELNASKIRNIYEMRMLIELHGLDVVQQQPEKHLPLFKKLLQEHKKNAERTSLHPHDYRELDKTFHKLLFTVTENPLIIDQFTLVSFLIHHSISDAPEGIAAMCVSIEYHISILEAICHQRWDEAKKKHTAGLIYGLNELLAMDT